MQIQRLKFLRRHFLLGLIPVPGVILDTLLKKISQLLHFLLEVFPPDDPVAFSAVLLFPRLLLTGHVREGRDRFRRQ